MVSAKGVRAGKAYVEVGADTSPLVAGIKGIGKSTQRIGASIGRLGTGFAAIGAGALAWPVKLAADLEKTSAAFETMLKDAGAAKVLLDDIQRFAASTPFQFPELADAGKKLLAFGTDAGSVTKELRMIGDIAAGLNIPIGELSEIYGKARVQGRLFAEDVNQLTGRGIPIIQEFAKQMGVAESEVKELVKSGEIGFSNLEQAFRDMTSETGKFAGGMERQSKTLLGIWSTLQDNIAMAVRPLGQALLPALNQAVVRMTRVAKVVAAWVKKNPRLVAGLGMVLAGTVAIGSALAVLGFSLAGIGTAISAIGTVAAAVFSPAGLIVGGIAAAVAGLGFLLHRMGLLQPLLAWIGRQASRIFTRFKELFGGVLAALRSGQWQMAGQIAFSGLKLIFLENLQEMLKGAEWFAANFFKITKKLFGMVAVQIVRLGANLPKLLIAGLKGQRALAMEIAKFIASATSGGGFSFSAGLDPAIQAERERFRRLRGQALRGQGRPVAGGDALAGGSSVQVQQLLTLQAIQRGQGLA